MLSARGERLLMVDADGASKFSDLDKLDKAMSEEEVCIYTLVRGYYCILM